MTAVGMRTKAALIAALCGAAMLGGGAASAQQAAAEFQISYSKGQFQPSQLTVPADKPFTLRVKNQDGKAMEFESKSLRVEKVIPANGEAVVNVRAQKKGKYEFFDEFNEKARGTVSVE